MFLMGTLGKVNKFDVNKKEWAQYKKRWTQFFLTNDTDNAVCKKDLDFLSIIARTKSYEIYCVQINLVTKHMQTWSHSWQHITVLLLQK